MEIKLIKSSFFQEKKTQKQLAKFVSKATFFSMRDECVKFEKKFAQWQKRKHAILYNSGSSANLALIQALLNLGKLKKNDKVGFSALTWATNVMPILQLDLKPVAIDCKKETLNVSLEQLKKHSDIRCLFITNVLGFSDDLKAIRSYCQRNNILLLEDNCESLGSKSGGVLLGNFGFASTFSFFVGHHMSTIEGGMVCTDDDELAMMLKMVRSHGWDRHLDDAQRKSLRKKYEVDEFYAAYTFYDLAYNLRPTEITGFLGNQQLNYLRKTIAIRQKNFKILQKSIAKNKRLVQLEFPHMDHISNFAVPLIYKEEDDMLRAKKAFLNAGVEIRPIIAGNMVKQPFYKKYVKETEQCPNADFIHSNGFYFGNNPELTKSELKYLSRLIET